MSESAVNWHEGMFLRPQHFQAADRFWHDQVRQSSQWDVHYNWGLRAVTLDADALRSYRADSPRDGLFDENTGQNARPVQLRRLNLRLLASTQDPSGYEVLPIARV